MISSLPNFTQLFPSDIRSGFATGTLEASVGKKVVVRQAGKVPSRLDPGKYLMIVKDRSKTAGFRITGPGVAASTGAKKTGTARFTITLQAGRYVYTSVGGGKTSKGLSRSAERLRSPPTTGRG